MKFIVWDEKIGPVPRSEDGGYMTSGLMGVIEEENVYLKSYAHYPEKRPTELEVHERCTATFGLSGSKGTYKIIRIE